MRGNATDGTAMWKAFIESTDPYAFIKHLVDNRTPETDYVEFKKWYGSDGPPDAPNYDRAKFEWLQDVCAFANSGDGFLVFGIDCDKAKETGEAEFAARLIPFADHAKITSLLAQSLQNNLEPLLLNLECRKVDDPNQPGNGYIVCFIPEGSAKPYRVRRPGIKGTGHKGGWEFYARSLGGSTPLGYALVKHMFSDKTLPQFRVTADLKTLSLNEPHIFDLTMTIENIGFGTASEVAIGIYVPVAGSEESRPNFPFVLGSQQGNISIVKCQSDIHPFMKHRVLSKKLLVYYPQDRAMLVSSFCTVIIWTKDNRPITFSLRLDRFALIRLDRDSQAEFIVTEVDAEQFWKEEFGDAC